MKLKYLIFIKIILFYVLHMQAIQEKFWIGIDIKPEEVNFVNLQEKYLKNKITKIQDEKSNPIKFYSSKYPHITIAEGKIFSYDAINDINSILEKIKFSDIPIIFENNSNQKIDKLILGQDAPGKSGKRFIVLLVDNNKSQELFNLVTEIRNKLLKLGNEKGNMELDLYGRSPEQIPIIHLSLGRINPSLAGLSFKQKKSLEEILQSINPHNQITSPILASALEKFRITNFKLVSTPNIKLTEDQLHDPKYVINEYKEKIIYPTQDKRIINSINVLNYNLLGLDKAKI